MSTKHQLDLPLLLPNVPDEHDRCVERLASSLEPHEGIEHVHVIEAANGDPAKLCIHYDSDLMPLPRIRQIAKSLGAEITDQYGHLSWPVGGVRHPRHARSIAGRLRNRPGILEAEVSGAGRVRVEYDRTKTGPDEIHKSLEELHLEVETIQARARRPGDREDDRDTKLDRDREPVGHPEEECEPEHDHDHDHGEEAGHVHDHGDIFGDRSELIFALSSGAALGIGFALSFVGGIPGDVSMALYIAAYLLGGYYTVFDAVESLRDGRFEVDFLMLVAALGAAVLGHWIEGAFLLFLFSTGHALEHYAMERARSAIESLADLAPETARVRRDGGEEEEVPVEDLRPGDIVVVRTNDRIPADGIVIKGQSEVDQSPVTGESVPVEKRWLDDAAPDDLSTDDVDPAHRVFAGTINGSSPLEVRVTRRSDETTLARVVQMVTEAEAETSPTQRFTDRFERYFVPAVLGLVVLLLFAWIPLEETFADSFYRAMAVLVAASPCALAIATPSAVLSGVARAGRGGVLVKGGGPLEHLGSLTALAFDKTGTLTEGKAVVSDVWANEGVTEEELLHSAVSVEQLSDHPLARAIVRDGRERLNGRAPAEVKNLENVPGRGIRAEMDGEIVHLGKDDLFVDGEDAALPEPVRNRVEEWEQQGRTTVIVRKGDRYLGVIGLMDTPRTDAKKVIEQLRRIGMRRMVMISGDNQRVATAVGEQVGIDEARGELLPDDKVATIKDLHKKEKVAMVGDGVNDAPAMANATVGIAMGAAGSDIALETADVALMGDRLDRLPFVVDLSRQTSRIIRQNLWIALGMVAILVPATMLGLNIGPAVVLHEGSTLLVVFNALRLLGYDGA